MYRFSFDFENWKCKFFYQFFKTQLSKILKDCDDDDDDISH